MEHDMIKASENKNYELAAKFRDSIALVRDITSHYSIFPENQSIDFILGYENESKLLVDINIIRNGVNMGCKNYIFSNSIDLIHEFFNLERKIKISTLSKSIQFLGKIPRLNKVFTKVADKGI